MSLSSQWFGAPSKKLHEASNSEIRKRKTNTHYVRAYIYTSIHPNKRGTGPTSSATKRCGHRLSSGDCGGSRDVWHAAGCHLHGELLDLRRLVPHKALAGRAAKLLPRLLSAALRDIQGRAEVVRSFTLSNVKVHACGQGEELVHDMG